MINQETYNAVKPLAIALSDKGITLAPRADTVLASLCSASTPVFESPSALDYDGFAFASIMAANDTSDGPSQHSLQLNGYSEDLGKLVIQHVSYAKNVVKPIVVTMAEQITTYLENNSAREAGSEYCVQIYDTPAPLKDEAFLSSVVQYKDSSAIVPNIALDLPSKNREEILALMLFGHDKTDKLIVEWLSSIEMEDPNFLEHVWFSFFSKEANDNSGYTSFTSLGSKNIYTKVNFALAIYLIARKIYDEVQEGSSLDLNVYKNAVAQLRDYGGGSIAVCLNRIALNNSTGILIVELNQILKTVSVNGDVYREWLTKGGKPEVILGALISNFNSFSLTAIDGKAAELEAKWNSFCNFYRTAESNKAFSYYKDFLQMKFYEMLSTLDQSEIDFKTQNAQYDASMKKLLLAEIDSLKTDSMEKPYEVALTLIAKCRFGFTGAYGILYDINEIGKVNPNIDVREAALIATINYIADYLTEQIAIIA